MNLLAILAQNMRKQCMLPVAALYLSHTLGNAKPAAIFGERHVWRSLLEVNQACNDITFGVTLTIVGELAVSGKLGSSTITIREWFLTYKKVRVLMSVKHNIYK